MVGKMLNAMLTALFFPLLVLNSFGGLIAAIWLAILGEWRIIFSGLVLIFFSSFALSFLLTPGWFFSNLAARFAEQRKKIVALSIGSLTAIYTMSVLIAFSLAILFDFTQRAAISTPLLPVLLWAYTAAMAPFAFMASKENNPQSTQMCNTSQLAFSINIVGILFFNFSKENIVATFLIAMVISALIAVQLMSEAFDLN